MRHLLVHVLADVSRISIGIEPEMGRNSSPVPLHPSVARYVDACHRVLYTKTGRPVLDWLTQERRLSLDVLEANGVGADPGPALLRRRRGLPRAGVAAVLPAHGPDGRLAYVQARYLDPEGGRKYGTRSHNSEATPASPGPGPRYLAVPSC